MEIDKVKRKYGNFYETKVLQRILCKILNIVLCNQKLANSNSLETKYFLALLARINYMFCERIFYPKKVFFFYSCNKVHLAITIEVNGAYLIVEGATGKDRNKIYYYC